ncbi:hypothetical protein SH661x_001667 [Planctomicrobium sp. SH661]|uniref:hypothetical protein n=1 Tax=Planctomicrobium sp. SH661 TaxID=3448124 RepID=UPI003F5C7622
MTRKHLGKIAAVVAGCVVCLTTAVEIFAEPKPEAAKNSPAQDNADEAKAKSLQEFMRLKLSASEKILEGLSLEDMDLVQSGADSLNKMSTAEKWRVSNDAMYRQFSEEFQRNTSELAKAAGNDNLDQAALKWFATTMSCIECHRYVRNNLVVK